MKFCSECGANVEGKKFCSECGAPVVKTDPAKETPKAAIKSPDQKEETKRKIRRNNWITLGIVLAVVLLASMWANVMNTPASGSSPKSQTTQQTAVKEISEPDFKAACVAQPYNDLARTPDSYKNMKLVITGKVVQVMEKSNGAQYRIAIDDNYDQMFYVDYTGAFGQGRILEDDTVTLWGTYVGLMSYNSTLGGKITIPSLIAKYYQIN
ncbi:MAG: hypothetical protein ABGU93_06845 [Acetobacterium sp.]|uniref:hypothetical protein n=1 Tax=Acetobacterium sp. TaxID=1872094 RepID=UPI003242C5AF